MIIPIVSSESCVLSCVSNFQKLYTNLAVNDTLLFKIYCAGNLKAI